MKKSKSRKIVCWVILVATISSIAFCVSNAATKESDYWTNKETWYYYYEGYIQFVPAYTTKNSNYGVPKNEHVKQAYINYSRNGQSVIGGRKYTEIAKKKTSGKTFYVTATCTDTLNPFAAPTKFNYNWITF